MVCATIIEWVPVLRTNEQDWFYLMLFPLLVCNAYQLSFTKILGTIQKGTNGIKETEGTEAIVK